MSLLTPATDAVSLSPELADRLLLIGVAGGQTLVALPFPQYSVDDLVDIVTQQGARSLTTVTRLGAKSPLCSATCTWFRCLWCAVYASSPAVQAATSVQAFGEFVRFLVAHFSHSTRSVTLHPSLACVPCVGLLQGRSSMKLLASTVCSFAGMCAS